MTEALASSEPSLPVMTVAVLSTTPQFTAAETATTWTLDVAPAAIEAAAKLSWLPTRVQPALGAASDHENAGLSASDADTA